jgi:hypothetical protein
MPIEPIPPTPQAVRRLLEERADACVSLHLKVPRKPGFDEVRAFPAEYEGAVRNAAQRMDALGVARERRVSMAESLRRVEVSLSALPPSTGTLAIFLGSAEPAAFALPDAVQESVHVARGFAVRPLLAALRRECTFRVVALAANDVQLFEGDARALRPIDRAEVPASLAEALGSELSESVLQLHSSRAHGSTPIFHGHGGASESRSLDRDRFHQALVQGLRSLWAARNDPLILAAGASHQGRFHALADLPGLLEKGIPRPPGALDPAELHALSLPLVREHLGAREEQALADARSALAHGGAVADVAQACLAVLAGRVERLWLDERERVPGHIEPADGSLIEPFGDDDVLDELAELAFERGGQVVVSGGLGEVAPVVAVLRGSARDASAPTEGRGLR